MNRNSHLSFNYLVYLENFPMRILVIAIFSLKTKEVQAGRFFDEMEKFKDGLALRPQTYRKIEVTDGGGSGLVGSCCGREVSAAMNFEAAKKYCKDLNKKLAGTVRNIHFICYRNHENSFFDPFSHSRNPK